MIKKCFGTIVDLLVVALEFFSVCPMCNYEAYLIWSCLHTYFVVCLHMWHWPMIILRHHLMTKGVHKTLAYVHVHCLRIWFGLVLPLLLPVCLYMRLCFLLDLVLRFSFCFVLELPIESCIMCVSIGQWFKSGTTEGKGVPSNLVVCVSTFLHTGLSLRAIPLPAMWPNLWG